MKKDRHPLARQEWSKWDIAVLLLTIALVFGGLVWWKTSAFIDCTDSFGWFTCMRMVR